MKNFQKNVSRNLQIIFLALVFVISAFGAAGDIDTSFNGALIETPAGVAALALTQPDNKTLVYGSFESLDGMPVSTLARITFNGDRDTTFNAPYFPLNTSSGFAVRSLALQSNGKILVGGVFVFVDGVITKALVRLNADGSKDTTFAFPSGAGSGVIDVEDIKVLPDDSIIFAEGSGIAYKLLPNGSYDTSFTPCVNASRKIRIQPDGKIVYLSLSRIGRCNANGTQDNTFQTINVGANDLDLQSDGKIVFGGNFNTVNGFNFPKLARANADGTIDASYPAANFTFTTGISKLGLLPNGKLLINGRVSSNTHPISRLNSNGSLDSGYSLFGELSLLEIQPVGTTMVNDSNGNDFILQRLGFSGSTVFGFQARFGKHSTGLDVFVQPDGKILAGGSFNFANNITMRRLTRFNADGSRDSAFNVDFNPDEFVQALDVQPDGKIIVGFASDTRDVTRLTPNGVTDFVFPNTKFATAVKVLSDGKILIASGGLKRFNGNGSPDTPFNPSINGIVWSFIVQPDGKIIIGGSFTQVNSTNCGHIARLNADGTLDTSFISAPGTNFDVYKVALQSNGKIIIGGIFTGVNFTTRRFLARLNSDGSLDTSFLPEVGSAVRQIKVQPDGKIIISGDFETLNGANRFRIARLNQNGTTDAQFNVSNGTTSDTFQAIDLQQDGKIIIAGNFSNLNGVPKLSIARLQNTFVSPKTLFDYDGDGRADVSVFRPSTNRWYQILSGNGSIAEQTIGIAGDIISPADYDGDGKTDIGIFRPSNGNWWYLSSLDGGQKNFQWGANGDIPKPSDFDGDGKADFIIFRPAENNWYRFGSSAGTSIVNFGLAGDKPVSGDFDGDGKSDVVIFRPSTGDWWWQSSVDNVQRATRWGISTDIPSPADFDGDGKTDFAVYRASTGTWYILNSGNGQATIINFGISEDKPVAADYDGDGKADIAVFRPSTGIWYLLRSTAGFTALQFGISTDIPTENAFVP